MSSPPNPASSPRQTPAAELQSPVRTQPEQSRNKALPALAQIHELSDHSQSKYPRFCIYGPRIHAIAVDYSRETNPWSPVQRYRCLRLPCFLQLTAHQQSLLDRIPMNSLRLSVVALLLLPSATLAQIDYDHHVLFSNSVAEKSFYYSQTSVVA